MCHNTCCWSLSTYMLDLLWVCSFHLFDRKLQHWFSTWRRWTWEGCWELRNPFVWSCDQKLFQRRMSLLPAHRQGLSPPNGEWPCCLSAARERKTPLFPWAEAPGEGGWGLACVYSLSWPGKHRRGRSVSAVAASPRGLWETSVWRAGGAPAVSGVDNELQVLQWVV